MADEQRHTDEEKSQTERDETMKDLDVSEDEGEDVRGGVARLRPADKV